MKDTNEIINLDIFRARKLEEKKRKTERIFFHQLIGIYSVVKPGMMVQIDLIDVSEEGLAIKAPYESEKTWFTDANNIPIRLYFSPESFMEITVDVKNSGPVIEDGARFLRYGCAIRQDSKSFEAWTRFVGFLKAFSEVSERDTGNISVGNL